MTILNRVEVIETGNGGTIMRCLICGQPQDVSDDPRWSRIKKSARQHYKEKHMSEITEDLAMLEIPSENVRIDYVMNPRTDDLIRGNELVEGMIVLIESASLRDNPERINLGGEFDGYFANRIRETSRWCRVTKLTTVSENPALLTFIGLYADGTKRSRTVNKSHYWLLKIAL